MRFVLPPDGEHANICHGVPSFPASRRSVLINGKVRRFLLTHIHNIRVEL